MIESSKRYSQIDIGLHFPGLIAIHHTQIKRTQCKIVGESKCIAGIKIFVIKEITSADKIIEENIGPPGKVGIH